jgi:aryl-alcohol dehydrogenase
MDGDVVMAATAAVVENSGGPFVLREIELEPLRRDEVRVRLVASGVCHTDAHMQQHGSRYPIVLGHEGAGIIDAVGDAVARVGVGDHIVMTFRYCGSCAQCVREQYAYCEHAMTLNFSGTRLDGTSGVQLAMPAGSDAALFGCFFGQSSFATYATANEQNVVKVADDLPLELLGPLGCGLQTGAGAVFNSLGVQAGASVAVLGAGGVGLAAVMAAAIVGADPIIAVDVVAERLSVAGSLGATVVVDAANEDVIGRVRTQTRGGADFVFNATGRPGMLATAVEVAGRRATIGFVGGALATEGVDWSRVLINGQTIRGVVQGDSDPHVLIPALVDWYRQGRFPIDRLVRFYDFSDINAAIADSAAGRTIKPVLRMGNTTG